MLEEINPDKQNDSLNYSNSDFERLFPLFDRQTMTAKRTGGEQAIFKFASEPDAIQNQLPHIFPSGKPGQNTIICIKGPSANHFVALASDKVADVKYAETGNGPTFCLPLYRYTDDGQRVSNITDWGLKRINDHYRERWGKDFSGIYPNGISPEDIFAYTYAVLHDPVYRHDYRTDLLREFPRLPLYQDFDTWAEMGQELLDLHINFETAEPYPLERRDTDKPAVKVMLRANKRDKERGVIHIDDQTTLSGVPESAWRYKLGNRSALEWLLDQYKEKKPRDPTIRERFNNYRFPDHKEQAIDLLKRVCAVSVKTMDVIDDMAYWDDDGKLVLFHDRDNYELSMLSMSQWFERPEEPEWEAAWSPGT